MRVVIAGGGTGGHLYPGIALAVTFQKLRAEARILFIGTTQGIGEEPLLKRGYQVESISVKGFIGKGLSGRLSSILSVPAALLQSLRILKAFSPTLVIGIGGYAAGPVLLAAILLGLKRVILEPNVVPGLSNRLVAPFCHMVVTAFEASRKRLRTNKISRLGMPVRPEILGPNTLGNRRDTEAISEKLGQRTLLILGGSQGAHSINRAMIAALPALKDEHLFVIHQTGKTDRATVEAAYAAARVPGRVMAFIEDMAGAYASADLVISRAGAGTLAELALVGKSSLLIPFPHAAGHQEENAKAFVSAGAALMLHDGELSGPVLAKSINALLADPVRRQKMEAAALTQGNAHAAEAIVEACLALSEA